MSSVDYELTANVENLTLTGTAVNASGNSGNNLLRGNAVANVIDGEGGADTMAGGAGNDTYYVDDPGDQIVELVGNGTDTVSSSVSFSLAGQDLENLILTGSAINALGNNLVNELTGNGGANVLDGKGGADSMAGGAGDDTYYVDDSGDHVTELGGAGTDTVISTLDYELTANVENLTIKGAAANATGNDQNNVLTGNANDNLLDGMAGADTMKGGVGNDTYMVDDAADQVVEISANGTADLVYSSVSYTLAANVENLILTDSAVNATGNADNNELTGNGGNNVLDGLVGADTMTGGVGDDTYYVDNVGDHVVEASDAGNDTVSSSVTYTLTDNVENLTLTGTATEGTGNDLNNTIAGNLQDNILTGGEGNDQLSGDDGNDYLTGENGNDELHGGAGADTLLGDDGTDRLDGGTGADVMLGGADDDTYVVDNAGDVASEGNNQGTDTVESSVTWTLGNFVENLTLTGSDPIDGTGNSLANVITGNAGANVINGGAGNDTLTGGDGHDTFVFSTALSSTTNVDHVTDFSTADDLFDLSHSVFANTSLGTLTDAEFHVGASATDEAQRIIYDKDTGALSYDADGSASGAAVQFATVTANTDLTHDHFVII
jgi:Ca2+-binding RTX toxin-like protein